MKDLGILSYLEPGFTLPSLKQLSMDINHKFETCKKLKKHLEFEASSIALTTEIWTSMATEAYMTVNTHYIDPSWKLQSFVLESLSFPERHTGVNIAEKLREVGETWGIIGEVITVSHDQASTTLLKLRCLDIPLRMPYLSLTPRSLWVLK